MLSTLVVEKLVEELTAVFWLSKNISQRIASSISLPQHASNGHSEKQFHSAFKLRGFTAALSESYAAHSTFGAELSNCRIGNGMFRNLFLAIVNEVNRVICDMSGKEVNLFARKLSVVSAVSRLISVGNVSMSLPCKNNCSNRVSFPISGPIAVNRLNERPRFSNLSSAPKLSPETSSNALLPRLLHPIR